MADHFTLLHSDMRCLLKTSFPHPLRHGNVIHSNKIFTQWNPFRDDWFLAFFASIYPKDLITISEEGGRLPSYDRSDRFSPKAEVRRNLLPILRSSSVTKIILPNRIAREKGGYWSQNSKLLRPKLIQDLRKDDGEWCRRGYSKTKLRISASKCDYVLRSAERIFHHIKND